eukprot:jgi/Mesvir1/21027/Mv08078-RA.2
MAGRKSSIDLTVAPSHSGLSSPLKSPTAFYESARHAASPTGSGSNAAQRLFRRTAQAPHVDAIRRPCTPPTLPSSPVGRASPGVTTQLDFPLSPQVGDARKVRVSESAERPMTAPSSLSQPSGLYGPSSPWAATRQKHEAEFLSNSTPSVKESPRRGDELPRPESPYRKTFKLRPNTHSNEALHEEFSYREEVADAIATVLRELERRGGSSSNYGAVINVLQRMAAAPHQPSRPPVDSFSPTLSCILPPEHQASTYRCKDGMTDRSIARRDISYLSDTSQRAFTPPRGPSEQATSLWDTRNSHDLLCRDAGGVYSQVLACQHVVLPRSEIPERYHVTMTDSSVELMLSTAEAAARTAKGKKDPMDVKFPSRQPSSRWEVLQLAKTVDDMMMELDMDVGGELGRGLHAILLESNHGAFGRVAEVIHIVLRELTRQVFVHCAERGALMAVLVQNLETMLAEATDALAEARADNRQLRESLSSSDARHREQMEASQRAYALQEKLAKEAEEAQKDAFSKLEKKFRQALEQLELNSRERDSLEMQVETLQKSLTDADKEMKGMLMEYAEKQEWHVQRRKKEIEVCFKREKDLLTLIKELRDNRMPTVRDPLGEIAAVEQRAAGWEAWSTYLLFKSMEAAVAPPLPLATVAPAWDTGNEDADEGDEDDGEQGEGEEGGRSLVDVVVVDFKNEGGRAGCKLMLEDIGEWIARRPEQFHLLVLDRASLEEVYDKHVDLDELLASVKTLDNSHLVAIHSSAATASLLKPHMANASGALFRLGARPGPAGDLSRTGSSGALTARGSPVNASAGNAGGASPAGGFCLLGVPDEKLEAAQAFAPELRAFLVRDEDTKLYNVTCVRNYYPLDIADLRFEGPGSGSSGAMSAGQLEQAVASSPTHQQQQVVLWDRASTGVQMVLCSFNQRLRRVFQHYALFAGAVGMDNPYFISFKAFSIFVKDCRIKLNDMQLHAIFSAANTHPDAPREHKEGDDASDMTLHEFYVAIVRIAALKRRRGTLALDAPLYELITQKILPHAKSLRVDAVFQAQFASKEVAEVLARTRPQLQRAFATFAAMGAESGGISARGHDGPATSEMDYQEWVLFVRRAGLIGSGISVSKAIACYVLANESFVTPKGEVVLDDKDQAMSFPEFEYAVAMLAHNMPTGRKKVSMATKLLTMLNEKVFTNLKAAGVQ